MPESNQNRKIIGTFHKSGSVLWQVICEQANKEAVFTSSRLTQDAFDPTAEVVLSLHAHTTTALLAHHNVPLRDSDLWVVCIRDPRDLIISAAHYHSIAKESWCHVPVTAFKGLTYQEKINTYSSLTDKCLFEMDNSAGRAIRNMTTLKQDLSPETAHFVRLEDLLVDVDLSAFRACFAFLRFDPGRLVDLLAIAVERSFFSDPEALARSTHARAGKIAEFRDVFDDRLNTEFHLKFPDSLNVLGYPENGWVPDYRPPSNVRTDHRGRMWPTRRPLAEHT